MVLAVVVVESLVARMLATAGDTQDDDGTTRVIWHDKLVELGASVATRVVGKTLLAGMVLAFDVWLLTSLIIC